MSSDAITPESRATARSGTFCTARALTIARQVASYGVAISARYGGGASGDTCLPPHPTSPRVTIATATLPRRMVIDPTIGIDEAANTFFIDLVERLDACPRGQRDARLHA